jgi:hypothetical protein
VGRQRALNAACAVHPAKKHAPAPAHRASVCLLLSDICCTMIDTVADWVAGRTGLLAGCEVVNGRPCGQAMQLMLALAAAFEAIHE